MKLELQPLQVFARRRRVLCRRQEDPVERLADGRELSVPLAWFPRLQAAPPAARQEWRLIGGGVGIHFPQVDEDLSVAGLLASR